MPMAQSGAIAMGENVVIRSIMFFCDYYILVAEVTLVACQVARLPSRPL